MGTGYKGGATHYHSIAENLPELTSKYKFQNGYFGERGTSSQIRVINCSDQYSESKAFYNKLAYGGIEEPLKKGNGVRTNMADGTIIIYREYTTQTSQIPKMASSLAPYCLHHLSCHQNTLQPATGTRAKAFL
ncbi:MAG: hypothetical protein SPL41_03225, partial [Succinivibrionaceae bacterium]|nr:hypothetical protein [Succinivibrionaceae bacterium]